MRDFSINKRFCAIYQCVKCKVLYIIPLENKETAFNAVKCACGRLCNCTHNLDIGWDSQYQNTYNNPAFNIIKKIYKNHLILKRISPSTIDIWDRIKITAWRAKTSIKGIFKKEK